MSLNGRKRVSWLRVRVVKAAERMWLAFGVYTATSCSVNWKYVYACPRMIRIRVNQIARQMGEIRKRLTDRPSDCQFGKYVHIYIYIRVNIGIKISWKNNCSILCSPVLLSKRAGSQTDWPTKDKSPSSSCLFKYGSPTRTMRCEENNMQR